jgi:uncharacterized protein (TIGR00290 family)
LAKKVLLAWSGGKDSCLALSRLRADPQVDVIGLVTTFVARYGRVQAHGIRRLLVQAQAEALGLPLHPVWLPFQARDTDYEATLRDVLAPLQRDGVEAVAFGDLFLQDIRAYRESLLSRMRLEGVFPLWGTDTAALAREIVRDGYRATVVCLDPTRVSARLLGRPYNTALLRELPESVDPCGENGEFHTFVHDGPGFAWPLGTLLGVHRQWQGQLFADLMPVARPALRRA